MPLCPQITITPITVTSTGMTQTSIIAANTPATTEQLTEVEVLVDGKAQIYYQTTAPVGASVKENDLWYDTDDGNKPYVFRSGVWVSAQDGSIATAQSAANTALANAATANAVGVAAQSTANTALANAATANAVGVAAQGTANTALANAATANAVGVAAQNTANTALANAATAYTTAQNSLQPSAYAIQNPTTKQLTSIDATGLTVYSGASATSGARVVLNSTGLAGFNSGGTATFSVSASTGAAVFSGSVTGATITGGTLNIGGNAIIDANGYLTATGATITGTITTSNITVTGGTLTIGSTFAVTAGGVLTATGATITGTLTSNNITVTGGTLTIGTTFAVTAGGVLTATGATITGTLTSNNVTITGGTLTIGTKFSVTNTGVLTATDGVFTGTITSTNATITGGSLTVGSTFEVTSAGVLTATSGTIGGSTLTSSTITGGTIRTSSGDDRVSLVGSTNSVTFRNGGTNVGHIVPLSSNGVLIHYGATANPSGGTFPQVYVGSGNSLLAASNSIYVSASSTLGINIQGNTTLNDQTTYPGIATGAGSTMVVVTTGSRIAYTTSSERFKQDIQYISTGGWLDKVLAMKPITYKTSEDFTTQGEPNETQIGFLAEDIADIGGGFETAVVLDPLGDPFSLSYDRLTVFLMLAIKELKAEINQLKGE